jgi:hypothetical protein
MSNATNSGKELQKQDSSLSGPGSTSSPNLRDWVKMEVQLLRECIPGPLLSVEAMQITQNMMVAIAEEIGTEKFHTTILKAIETCDRRPTVAKIRQLAGLNSRLEPAQEAAAKAWGIVVTVLTRHIGRDGEGNVILRPFLSRAGDAFHEKPVPDIPEGVRKAVAALGGWGALAESFPQWNGQKWGQWKELYNPDPAEIAALLASPPSTSLIKSQP